MNSTSEHILNTSSNLLGFCLIIITSLKITNYSEKTTIDEFAGVAALLFMTSSLLSFLSIRSKNTIRSDRIEKWADIFFLVGLVFISVTVAVISFQVIL
jgi:hypothetical protein